MTWFLLAFFLFHCCPHAIVFLEDDSFLPYFLVPFVSVFTFFLMLFLRVGKLFQRLWGS